MATSDITYEAGKSTTALIPKVEHLRSVKAGGGCQGKMAIGFLGSKFILKPNDHHFHYYLSHCMEPLTCQTV